MEQLLFLLGKLKILVGIIGGYPRRWRWYKQSLASENLTILGKECSLSSLRKKIPLGGCHRGDVGSIW